MIDGVNALIIQLHQTLSLRGASNAADVNADENVSPDGGDTPSGGDSGGSGSGGSDDPGTEMGKTI